MVLTKKEPAKRGRKPKTPDGVNLVNTAEEVIKEAPLDGGNVKPPREQKAGPKKVINETQKAIADAAAAALSQASGGADGRGLLFTEAQSITTPLTRIAGRRVPKILKNYSPKIKMNPDDAADVEEIVVTIGKYFLRLLMLLIKEMVENKEKTQAQRQQAQGSASRPNLHLVPTPIQPRPVPVQQEPSSLQQEVIRQYQEDIQAVSTMGDRVGVGGGTQLQAFEGIGAYTGEEGA
jgi:hypothetical protein